MDNAASGVGSPWCKVKAGGSDHKPVAGGNSDPVKMSAARYVSVLCPSCFGPNRISALSICFGIVFITEFPKSLCE